MPVLDSLASLFQTQPMVYIGCMALLGLFIGSFLNVVILRLPVMMQRSWDMQCRELLELEPIAAEKFNLNTPRSRCPNCGHLIRALENIPVLSYLVQRGRCKHCAEKISPRYPLIELFTALLTGIVAWKLGFGWQGAFAILLTWMLIALAFIDIDHQLLPDDITLPGLWLGLGLSLFALFTDMQSALIGAIAGYLSLWLIYHGFRILTKKEGMGYGDFKLFALFGAWFGWQQLPLIILLSSLVGAVIGIAMITFMGRDRQIPIPFGPYLAGAGWLAMLWGHEITTAYINSFG
ncbi:MAG: A24 family peptidase [Gammaproteobacteria bacterium]|nr:A24 family peptidase [Gammaproteobacteria bacterium]MCW8927447.1 A24 family peptidase [Gammaproteobacteria bacterium]MCW8958153.1 A24 family peptidase [Gammaproteobacteria bacterium]MCW8973880.1 A24 family peptidase [Gammaproteobacteria bacterium]MCW8993983.1 A24 family peptidase [Gammaproteobacteria bacterium]